MALDDAAQFFYKGVHLGYLSQGHATLVGQLLGFGVFGRGLGG